VRTRRCWSWSAFGRFSCRTRSWRPAATGGARAADGKRNDTKSSSNDYCRAHRHAWWWCATRSSSRRCVAGLSHPNSQRTAVGAASCVGSERRAPCSLGEATLWYSTKRSPLTDEGAGESCAAAAARGGGGGAADEERRVRVWRVGALASRRVERERASPVCAAVVYTGL
jgi:hypothetical protein